jgi:prepilin-type N-terminal cleavage/methylation domain-containing protein
MKVRTHQRGFSAVELVLAVAVLAVLGLVGYTVHNRQHKTTTAAITPTSSQKAATPISSQASTISPAPTVNSTSDLDKASQTLDQNDPAATNSSDSSQLDSQTNNL